MKNKTKTTKEQKFLQEIINTYNNLQKRKKKSWKQLIELMK
jgi:hypothetical protein